jgi:glutamine cyclotransferase
MSMCYNFAVPPLSAADRFGGWTPREFGSIMGRYVRRPQAAVAMMRGLRWKLSSLLRVAAVALAAGCQSATRTSQPAAIPPIPTAPGLAPPYDAIPVYTYKVLHTYPHDTNAYTEGLVYRDGQLYESTGLRGQSELRRVELETGEVVQKVALPNKYFGEGLTIYDSKLIQLTWQTRVGFVYDLDSFKLLRQFNFGTEGWGLTQNGQYLIRGDGSSTLYLLDPNTFEEVGRIDVQASGQPVFNLNELEYIDGEIFANVWKTDRIARIDPQTGHVVGWIDLSGLLSPREVSSPGAVLNGIAYDVAGQRLFVTGKNWPHLFEIQLIGAVG